MYHKTKQNQTKSSDGGAPVLELWRMWSTLSLQLHPGPLWPRGVVPVWVQSVGQIGIFNHLNKENYLTLLKRMTDIQFNY